MRRSSLPFNSSILRPILWCKVALLKQEQGDKKHDHTFFVPDLCVPFVQHVLHFIRYVLQLL
ncbi:hypothetical protein GIB67_030639 [Kingdonia uniflora]|uniref:Uncharacterized protein n=1 Tax=Kingdonia uniflora TaxID=39325 RepID=A0A7J7LI75_9MAGN|nr:hypothetical protein GIB67_030639 [Kingdonia uniflora]